MFFKPRFSTKTYMRRGFRLRGNTLVLLLIFFLIGLFLHYGGKTQPVVSFWNDLRQVIGLGRSKDSREGSNPYKAPEPADSPEAEADNTRTDESEASDKGGNKARPAPSGNVRFDFEKQADFILPLVKPGDDIIRHDGYTLRYRDQYKDADWVAYPLLPEEINGDTDREGSSFRPDPTVQRGTAVPADYTRSGYDRGHLAPAGDFKFSRRMMQETFFMSNITPQAPQFNRGIWKELEDQVRQWALRDNGLYVVTGPVLKPGLPTIGRSTEISVPEKFYKVILYCNKPDIRMIGFLLNNEASTEPLRNFVVPVDLIEQLTGIDFFPKLPDELERKLESKSRNEMVDKWF